MFLCRLQVALSERDLEFGHFLGCQGAIFCGGEFLQAAAR
jgi:hypothetical protein